MKFELKAKLDRTFAKAKTVSSGRLFSRQLTYLVDSALTNLFLTSQKDLAIEGHICLIAIGGYGRMELSPYSDIDLLYLHDGELSDNQLSSLIGRINTYLYDNGKEVGHACRTIEESFLYLDTLESFHAILDSRFLAGSKDLYKKYQADFLKQLPQDRTTYYNEYKVGFLKKRIIDAYEPLLLSEPNIKIDPLGLRDIQFMYWTEKTGKPSDKIETGVFDYFFSGQTQPILAAYDFLLISRAALHIISGRKNDRLDLSLQGEVAEFLGFGNKNELKCLERFMSKFYKCQKDVYFFLGMYIEVKTKTYSEDSVRIFSNPDTLYEDTMNFFLDCQSEKIEPSRIALNELRFASNFLEEDYKNSKPVIDSFLKILNKRYNIGHLMTLMHECNILGKLIPEFGACSNFPLFSYHHQYTVDEHTLLILRELDKLESGTWEDAEVQGIYSSLEQREILILAILIHDAGKVKEGDHSQYGAELSIAVSERLGLTDNETELFRFLVAEHIAMSELSSKRDIYDPNLIKDFSKLFPNKNWLGLLYVLTIIDTKSVGRGVLTNWKKEILHALYELTYKAIEERDSETLSSENTLDGIRNYWIQKEGIHESIATQILTFTQKFKPQTFLSYNTPRKILHLFTNLVEWRNSGELIKLLTESEPAFLTISFFAKQNRDLLLYVSGCISSLGLNLVGLRQFESPDKEQIIQAQVTDSFGSGSIPETKITELKEMIMGCIRGKLNIEEIALTQTIWSLNPKVPKGMVEEMIKFSNDPRENFSILEIRLPDSLGLLFRILKAILSCPVNVIFVRIATSADYAYDSFYIQTLDGLRIDSTEILLQLKEKIYEAMHLQMNEGFLEINF